MKIVHICLCGQFNENFSYQDNLLTKHHSLLGHEVSIIAPTIRFTDDGKNIVDLKNSSTTILPYNITLFRVQYRYKFPWVINDKLRLYKGVFNLLKLLKPDFIFIHGVQFLESYTIVRYLKEHPKVISVADNHADENNSINNFISKYLLHGLLWRITANKLNKVCEILYGVTPNRVDFLHKQYKIPLNRIRLLTLGADDNLILNAKQNFNCDRLKSDYKIDNTKKVIVTGGKIDLKKNFGKLVDCLSRIKNKNFELVVFGSFMDKDIQTKFSKYDFVKLVGWKNQQEVVDLFLMADLVCFPGSHSVLWEQAVACGKPAIFNNIRGMNHISINGNAILVDANNESELEEVILEILYDESKLNSMTIQAQKIAKEFYYSSIAQEAINVG